MTPAASLSTIGFDADDTLWQNEQFFRLTEERFAALLADYGEPADYPARLLEAESRNLQLYGFGIKGFTLSMIETAIELTEGGCRPRSSARSLPLAARCWPSGRDLAAMPRNAGSACRPITAWC